MSKKNKRKIQKQQNMQNVQQNVQNKPKESKKGKGIIIFGVVIVILVAVGFFVTTNLGTLQGQYDEFAQCLNDNGAVMYGAYWCSNCQRQELMLGPSFEFVNYVECDVNGAGRVQSHVVPQPEKCTEDGITGYPTWIFADESRVVGAQTLQVLSQTTGCELPEV
ncbi:MAG: hypothetical protein ABIJ92_01970 [Candidatus Aenigmatarchaeota archaeon]